MRLARVSDGEAFGLLTNNPEIDARVQLDLRLVEAEQVTSPTLALDRNRYVDGIQFDAYGDPVSYDVLREHDPRGLFHLLTARHPGKREKQIADPLTRLPRVL